MRIALKIAYDGTKFNGFQRQPELRTVEGEIIRVLQKLNLIESPDKANFKGASRTDKGVSAFGNVVAFNTENPKLAQPRILNHHLRDVWVLGIAQVPDDFHPRFWARSKIYRYYLVNEGFDVDAMRECGELFVGTHDFSAFARLEKFKDPIREIIRLEIAPKGDVIVIEIEGKSFLWEMVRRIVTALKLCGLGVIGTEDVRKMLNGKANKKLPPAPPENLVLWEIKYDKVNFQIDEYSLKKIRQEFFERFSYAMVKSSIFRDWLLSL
ncbi:tRNA pseudouridine(38-40) synthase TruA [Thermococcus sp. M39]|uniref:tRNA pseudouridine(38-40) synthase TruA n=1 Tax=unclassified Thermococcus TaxID=2627626 RepID=UPI001439E95A|nr:MULTISPECIES: tRNA pseudouridine(38-40) synthase TruA [unclassified Thermococcus]NJE07476.1 tRNA pseudouridine(38-40) synthase TruA [Thermococcus sp. M39]NJE12391.1 tRNA pseudouridine(38-40) synthase TruA [Thermococcus sp. LS2]